MNIVIMMRGYEKLFVGVVVIAIDRNRAGPLLAALNATFKKMKLRHSDIVDHG